MGTADLFVGHTQGDALKQIAQLYMGAGGLCLGGEVQGPYCDYTCQPEGHPRLKQQPGFLYL